MTIESRLVKLLGAEHGAKVWEKIKYWRHEQQFEKWRELKARYDKEKLIILNKRV
jgi:hypothetical protein